MGQSRPKSILVASPVALLGLLAGACASMLYCQVTGQGTTSNAVPVDAAALIKAVDANQKQIEAARKDYIFHRRDEEPELDSHGHLKSTKVREYEVYFIGPWEIDRLLSKDGRPLNEGEQKKQDEEVRKQEAKARERIAKRDSGEDREKDEITVAKFLAADRFYHLRRGNLPGTRGLCDGFCPAPGFSAPFPGGQVIESAGRNTLD